MPRQRPVDRPDIVLPRDFDAGYGEGVRRGVSLGGGGLWFIAWQVAYLRRLASEGIVIADADRVVGTSAGSVVATTLLDGHLTRVHRELSLLGRLPGLGSVLAPTGNLRPSQQRALDLFIGAADAEVATIRVIGAAALAARTPPPGSLRRSIALLAGGRRWPSPALRISCVDAYSGERGIVTEQTGVAAAAAAAASSAVPGIFPPYPIGDRRCMDGGVSGTGVHLDVLAGANRVLVLGLTDGAGLGSGMMTVSPGAPSREIEQLAASGTDVVFRVPERVDPDRLMDPAAIPDATAMGVRQADADRGRLRAFWSPAG